MRIPRLLHQLAVLWCLLFFIGCVFYPLTALIFRAASASVAPGNGGFLAVLLDPEILSVAQFTLKQALLSTGISCVLGFVVGYFIGPLRLARTLLALPFGIPTVIVALALTAWLGRSGVFARLGIELEWAYTLKAVILAHVLLNAPWVALWISQARMQIPRNQLEAASTLGAGPWRRLKEIEWPYLKWSLASSGVQVFSLCVMSFALVLILGGGPPVQTLETEIYSRIRLGSLDLPGAMASAFWELLLTLIPWSLLLFVQARGQKQTQERLPVELPTPMKLRTRRGLLPSLFLAGVFLVPYGVLFESQALQKVLSLVGGGEFFQEIAPALFLSLRLALTVAVLTVLTAGAAILLGKKVQWISILPAGLSILVLGLGFWLAYGQWLDPFEGSFIAILLLQVTIAFPLAYRSLWPIALGLQKSRLEAALTLGAGPVRAFFQVEWPRWRAPLLKVFAISFGVSLGEVAAVSLFYSERLIPIPLLITRWMGQYRFEEAQALALLLFLLGLGSMIGLAQGASETRFRQDQT